MKSIDLLVPAMSCGNCVSNIKKTLGGVDGVSEVVPELDTKRVAVRFDPAKVSEKQIATALAKLGFSSSPV